MMIFEELDAVAVEMRDRRGGAVARLVPARVAQRDLEERLQESRSNCSTATCAPRSSAGPGEVGIAHASSRGA